MGPNLGALVILAELLDEQLQRAGVPVDESHTQNGRPPGEDITCQASPR